MSTVYGPVCSWRFGRSLGIDVISPPKKCTFDCIYCQLGKTKIRVSKPEMLRETYVSPDEISSDLDDVLRRIDLKTIDVVTFSGSGEPTLNPDLGIIARQVKAKIGRIPMVLLTNSSLFSREDVRRNLSKFDIVVAKLDAGDEKTFKMINRPADKELSIETIIDSIKKLKKEIEGDLALEVMLLESENKRVSNIEGNPLKNLINAIIEVEPDIVQLEVPYRPPSMNYVKQPPQEKLKNISRELSEVLGEEKLWVYGTHDRRGRNVKWLEHKSLEDNVLSMLRRRPCRLVDVSASLGIDLTTTREILRSLEERSQVNTKLVGNEQFYFERKYS